MNYRSDLFRLNHFVAFGLVMVLAWSQAGFSQEGDAPQADAGKTQIWFGKLDIGAATLRLKFVITNNDGALSGKMYSLDQTDRAIPVDSITVEGTDVEIDVSTSIKSTFKGTLNEDKSVVEGTWAQSGKEFPLTLKKVDDVPAEPKPTSVWRGDLDAGIAKLKIQLRVFEKDGEEAYALFDSLSQGAKGIKATFESDGDEFKFGVPAAMGIFNGKLNEDKSAVTGTWKQAGREFELELKKVDSAIDKLDVNRPQHPEAPYPYREELVTIENTKAECTLAGTLTLPKEKGKYPAVILISGSGPQDRDETLLGHKPFLVIADHLTKNGVAVLRYDDRGVGESTGEFETATSRDFASDVYHLVKFLRTKDEIDPNRIGLVGHSEGGLIAPMVAEKLPGKIAHVVLLAGPGVDGATILESQSRAMAKATGESDEEIEEGIAVLKKVVSAIGDGEPKEKIDEMIEELVAAEEAEAEDGKGQAMAIRSGLGQMTSDWFRYFIKYDPYPTLKKVACPVLALNGEKDLQVLVDLNLDAIEKALKEGGNSDFRCVAMPDLNHLFQKCETGSPMEYQSIEETFSTDALKEISDWVLKH